MSASFQSEEAGLEHQVDMPDYPSPEMLEEDRYVIARAESIEDLDSHWATRERAFDIRSVYPADRQRPANLDNPTWMKFKLPVNDDPALHRYLLAYASDMGFVGTSFIPHRDQVPRDTLQMASLDHTLWFHRSFRVDEWLLYLRTTPSSSGSRGFNQGAFYTADGRLVASTMQEGLMRVR